MVSLHQLPSQKKSRGGEIDCSRPGRSSDLFMRDVARQAHVQSSYEAGFERDLAGQ